MAGLVDWVDESPYPPNHDSHKSDLVHPILGHWSFATVSDTALMGWMG